MVAEIFGLDGAVVAVIAVAVLFGAKRLPEMARSSAERRESSRRVYGRGTPRIRPWGRDPMCRIRGTRRTQSLNETVRLLGA